MPQAQPRCTHVEPSPALLRPSSPRWGHHRIIPRDWWLQENGSPSRLGLRRQRAKVISERMENP